MTSVKLERVIKTDKMSNFFDEMKLFFVSFVPSNSFYIFFVEKYLKKLLGEIILFGAKTLYQLGIESVRFLSTNVLISLANTPWSSLLKGFFIKLTNYITFD